MTVGSAEAGLGVTGAASALDRVTAITLAFLCLASLPWIVATLLPPLNHDVAAILQFAERWVAGERLYVDLIDMNPPLIFALSVIPVLLDRVLPVDAAVALVLCVYAFGLLQFRLSVRVLHPELSARDLFGLAFVPLFVLVLGPLAGFNFAQREHLMMLAALPYLFHAEARMAGRTWIRGATAWIAIVAALGFCLKHYFLIVPIAIEGYLLLRRGWRETLRDPTPRIMMAVGSGYALIAFLLFPSYFSLVLPLARSNYASLGGMSMMDVLSSQIVLPMATIGFLLIAVTVQFSRSERARILAVASLAGLLVGVVQRKGWPYHFVPAESFIMFLAGALLAEWGSQILPPQEVRRRAAALAMVSALLGVGYLHTLDTRESPWRQATYDESGPGQLAQVLKHEAANAPVLVLSPAIYPIYPALNYAHAPMAMRFMNMWLVQGAYSECLPNRQMYRNIWDMPRSEFYAYRAVAEDFARRQPAVLVVDSESGIPRCGAEFSYIEYFRRHPLFAENFRHYVLQRRVDRFDIYVRR
ncbi:MAG: hypothetical protein IT557_16715 [Alphaproteobacteria bacterium]|nr:hypothetical protein [Alphaproteobacteria bacterium]